MRNIKRQSLILSAPSSPLQPEEPRFDSTGNRTSSLGLGLNGERAGSRHSFLRINPNDSRVLSLDSLTDSSNIKLLLIGDAGVGKTAMILSYCNELPRRDGLTQKQDTNKSWQAKVKNIEKKKRYSLNDFEGVSLGDESDFVINTSSTIGIDIKTNLVSIDNRFFKVIMWDTAGQERYRNAMISSLYKGSNGIILSYDICDFNSFQNCLNYWFLESIKNIPDLRKTHFYLVGNKLDLYGERKVMHDDVLFYISKLENDYGVKIAGNFEVSCKWENVVERTFNIIIKDLVEGGCYEDDRELRVEESWSSEESEDTVTPSSTAPGVRHRKPHITSRAIDLTKPLSGSVEANSHSSKGSTCCA